LNEASINAYASQLNRLFGGMFVRSRKFQSLCWSGVAQNKEQVTTEQIE